MRPSRREFLRLSILAVVASLVGSGCSSSEPGPPASAAPHDPEAVFAAYFAPENLATVAAIGRAWLDNQPDPTLVPTIDQALQASGEDEAVDKLRAAVRADFQAGELVAVEGWHLARTEVHLCALVELTGAAS